jgi:hypothetical protein
MANKLDLNKQKKTAIAQGQPSGAESAVGSTLNGQDSAPQASVDAAKNIQANKQLNESDDLTPPELPEISGDDGLADSYTKALKPAPNPLSKTASELVQAPVNAIKSGNPFSVVGGILNAISPETPKLTKDNLPDIDENGEQRTIKATDNPDSLVGMTTGYINSLPIFNKTTGFIEKLLGIAPEGNQSNPAKSNLFTGENQAKTSWDDAANQAYDDWQNSLKIAPFSDIGANIASAKKAKFDQIMTNRNTELGAKQQIGIGTPEESSAFKKAAQNSQAIADATDNLKDAVLSKNPQRISSALAQGISLGIVTDPNVLNASSQGKLLEYITSAQPVAVSKIINGTIKEAVRNAKIKSGETHRIGDQILPGDTDTASKFFKGYSDPNYGIDVEGVSNAADKLGEDSTDEQGNVTPSFEKQRQGQIKNIGQQSGEAESGETMAKIAALANSLAPDAKKAFLDVVGHYTGGKTPSAGEKPSSAPKQEKSKVKKWNPSTNKFE